MCKNPYIPPIAGPRSAYPCNKCIPCLVNRKRLWTSRILLESMVSPKSSFLTLTYATAPNGGTLVPKDLQDFFKRLRAKVSPVAVRYYAVGEYGDETWRPHYHAALFGLGPEDIEDVRSAWSLDGKSLGHVMLGDVSSASASYVAGYVTKKMTAADDARLEGRYPEFSRMSRRPGLGAHAMDVFAKAILSQEGLKVKLDGYDVPYSFRHANRLYPFGRYLRARLRRALDIFNVDPRTGEVTYGARKLPLQESQEELSRLFEVWSSSTKDTPRSFKDFIVSERSGSAALTEYRENQSRLKRSLI